nr:hypothetical protein [uncultured Dyadobacter sp.]
MSSENDELESLRKDHSNNLLKIKEKSEDDFDKNITAIAAGTLAITLTFHQIIVKATETDAHCLLFGSWVFLGLLMVLNLISNYITILQIQTSVSELNEKGVMNDKANERRIRTMNRLNFIKIVLLSFGLTFFLTYVIINMSKKTIPGKESDKPSIGTRTLIPVPKKLRENPSTEKAEKDTKKNDAKEPIKKEN